MSDVPELVKRLAAAVTVALAALVLVASAGASAKKTRFHSKRYHYSLQLVGGSSRWLDVQAVADWPGDYPSLTNVGFDRLSDLKTSRVWLIAAKRVPKKMTLKRWIAYTFTRVNPSCSRLSWHSKVKLGGARARRDDFGCPEGRVIDIAALHAHRGYLFICISGKPAAKRGAAQRACRAVQRSFRFTRH